MDFSGHDHFTDTNNVLRKAQNRLRSHDGGRVILRPPGKRVLMTTASAEADVVENGAYLARDLLIAQNRGCMKHMLDTLNLTDHATLIHALMRMAAYAEALSLHIAGGDGTKALEVILASHRGIRSDVAAAKAAMPKVGPLRCSELPR